MRCAADQRCRRAFLISTGAMYPQMQVTTMETRAVTTTAEGTSRSAATVAALKPPLRRVSPPAHTNSLWLPLPFSFSLSFSRAHARSVFLSLSVSLCLSVSLSLSLPLSLALSPSLALSLALVLALVRSRSLVLFFSLSFFISSARFLLPLTPMPRLSPSLRASGRAMNAKGPCLLALSNTMFGGNLSVP